MRNAGILVGGEGGGSYGGGEVKLPVEFMASV